MKSLVLQVIFLQGKPRDIPIPQLPLWNVVYMQGEREREREILLQSRDHEVYDKI